MADGNAMALPEIRIGVPIIEDFAWLARRMRADEIAQFLALTGLTEYQPDIAARVFACTTGTAFVLVDRQNLPVCAGGFEPIRPGVYQTWMVGTAEGWAQHWRAITKHSRRAMDDLFARDARRIQTYALASRKDAHEWYARGLKQTFEGLHRQFFADGQDAVCYARVRGD